MDPPAQFSINREDDGAVAVLTGDWTAVSMGDAAARLRRDLGRVDNPVLDLNGVVRCDTAGAFAILRAAQGRIAVSAIHAPERTAKLLELVERSLHEEQPPPPRNSSIEDLFDRIGRGLVGALVEVYETMAFMGHLLVVTARTVTTPGRMRWAACFNVAERAGLDAIPIVALTTFFVGAVIGFIGAHELSQFGATVFVVELIGIAVMREFNIIITAVLLAGRSASSFAAEIGAMKMQQEIDAMRTIGVDPFEALVLPRFIGLLITIPLLTFVATLAGLAGGLMVAWLALDISPAFFIQRILDNVGVTHFWLGIAKSPVMAVVIAGIGCRQGLEVGGDVESLGRRVTAAVVHAVFSIIMIDALFALLYLKLDL